MKSSFFLFLLFLLISSLCFAQTIQYSEDFESAPYNVVETTTGTVNWSLNSSYYSQGANSYSSVVEQNDSSMLTTTTIDCSGNNFVLLEFDHICKIYVLDAAEIFVSSDNGTNWTKLDGSHYLGNSQFTAQGNKFTSSAYTTLWDPSNPTSINNSWWKTEAFDISSIAGNSSQVKIKFLLSDGNGLGAENFLGWFLDNIKVTVAIDELIPPTISLVNPYPKDTVYYSGPYIVKANILDASGILMLKHNMKRHNRRTIITPHYGEFSKLMEVEVEEIVNDPLKYIKKCIETYDCEVILKGPSTIYATKDKTLYINQGTPALAKAGSGDVLAGICLTYAARNLPIEQGILVHMLAGQKARELLHEESVLANHIIDQIPNIYKTL